ncbi:ABC transporter permease [Desulfurobacterium sp.]
MRSLFSLLVFSLVFVAVILIVMVLFSIVFSTSPSDFWRELSSDEVLSSLLVSLETSIAVVFVVAVLGLPVAYLLSFYDFPGKVLIDTLFDIPVVFPPLVSGLGLLILFGGTGVAGKFLLKLGIHVIFSQVGIVVAQTFVSLPLFVRTVRESFNLIPRNLVAAARTLGASQFTAFTRVILPLSKSGIVAGLVLSWARAVGEFGATAMVAGAIPGKTETLTIGIYMESMSGNLSSASAMAVILITFSIFTLLFFKMGFGRKKWDL